VAVRVLFSFTSSTKIVHDPSTTTLSSLPFFNLSAEHRPTLQAPARPLHSPAADPATLPAIIIVIVVIVVVMIIVIANPPHGTITIANAITIAAPSWCIVGSTMATITGAKQGDIYEASNIVLPCPGS
jgi:hypothetical protein